MRELVLNVQKAPRLFRDEQSWGFLSSCCTVTNMRKKRGKLQEDEVRYIESILDEDIMEALGELESNNRLYLHGMFEQVTALVDYVKSQRQEF